MLSDGILGETQKNENDEEDEDSSDSMPHSQPISEGSKKGRNNFSSDDSSMDGNGENGEGDGATYME